MGAIPPKTARNERIHELRQAGLSYTEIHTTLREEGYEEITYTRVRHIAKRMEAHAAGKTPREMFGWSPRKRYPKRDTSEK